MKIMHTNIVPLKKDFGTFARLENASEIFIDRGRLFLITGTVDSCFEKGCQNKVFNNIHEKVTRFYG